jgi:hypothetical protein
VNKVNHPILLNPRTIKPWETQKAFDTLYQLAGTNTKGHNLGNMAKVFGIDDPFPDIDGSMIWQLWKEKKETLIEDYCASDVRITRELYKRIRDWV